jgi:hypothetical protein
MPAGLLGADLNREDRGVDTSCRRLSSVTLPEQARQRQSAAPSVSLTRKRGVFNVRAGYANPLTCLTASVRSALALPRLHSPQRSRPWKGCPMLALPTTPCLPSVSPFPSPSVSPCPSQREGGRGVRNSKHGAIWCMPGSSVSHSHAKPGANWCMPGRPLGEDTPTTWRKLAPARLLAPPRAMPHHALHPDHGARPRLLAAQARRIMVDAAHCAHDRDDEVRPRHARQDWVPHPLGLPSRRLVPGSPSTCLAASLLSALVPPCRHGRLAVRPSTHLP